MRDIRVGPAGWSYSDWAGYVYPPPRPKGFHEATYLARSFDTIEINTSFYQPFNPSHSMHWLDRCSATPLFTVTTDACQTISHDPKGTPLNERRVPARLGHPDK